MLVLLKELLLVAFESPAREVGQDILPNYPIKHIEQTDNDKQIEERGKHDIKVGSINSPIKQNK